MFDILKSSFNLNFIMTLYFCFDSSEYSELFLNKSLHNNNLLDYLFIIILETQEFFSPHDDFWRRVSVSVGHCRWLRISF